MDDAGSLIEPPVTPSTPLQPASSDRVNHQLPALGSALNSPPRDGDVHDKIRQFNNLSHFAPGTASMSKQLERMTADAALRRAMIGREEAESEMRRYRDETRILRKQVEEGRERERRVGERLETVMESYGRAKETYSHTQAVWEKEIRRARKETFKTQSNTLKLQEDLKSTRATLKSTEESLGREKELSKEREQEASASRDQLAALQEELEKARERIQLLEGESGSLKTTANSEGVSRIAAEAVQPRFPEDLKNGLISHKRSADSRDSLSSFDLPSSAATDEEMEELTRLWQWEKRRADRTQDHLEFVQAEFELFSSRRKSNMRRSMTGMPRQERAGPIEIVDPSDLLILGNDVELRTSPTKPKTKAAKPESQKRLDGIELPARRESRLGTVFVPSEGIFRTISQQDLEAMEQDNETTARAPSPITQEPEPHRYTRSPSNDPPAHAMAVTKRTSLLSLLNAPRQSDIDMELDIPTRTGDDSQYGTEDENQSDNQADVPEPEDVRRPSDARPHTSAAFYTVTKTTTVPMKGTNNNNNIRSRPQQQDHHQQQRKQLSRTPSFDVNNPALIPTMSREEALAQIRERRGRARSAMQGAVTPRKQMLVGVTDRNVSAPAGGASTTTTVTKGGSSSRSGTS